MSLPLFPFEVLEVSAIVFMESDYEVGHVKSFWSIANNQWLMLVFAAGVEENSDD